MSAGTISCVYRSRSRGCHASLIVDLLAAAAADAHARAVLERAWRRRAPACCSGRTEHDVREVDRRLPSRRCRPAAARRAASGGASPGSRARRRRGPSRRSTRSTLPVLPRSRPAMTITVSSLRIGCARACVASEHLRRERDDLHELLRAQLARDRSEDAGADRLALRCRSARRSCCRSGCRSRRRGRLPSRSAR